MNRFRAIWIALVVIISAADAGRLQRVCGQDSATKSTPPILVIDAGGHTGWTNRVLYWPYKNELISVSHDKSIRFWDLETGEPTRVLRPPIDRGNAGRLHAASLSPDNKYLAVGGESALRHTADHSVYLIDPIEGRIVKSLAGHPTPIRCVSFSPDGTQLATSCYDEKIRLFNVATGAVRLLNGHTDSVVELAWSPDGRSLISGSWDKTARIWDVSAGQTRSILPHSRSALAVAWSPDGRTIATGSSDKSVRLWGTDGSLRQVWPASPEHIDFVNFSPNSSRLVYGWGGRHSSEHGSAVVDLRTGAELCRYLGQQRNALDGMFLPDGQSVVTVGFGGDIVVWDATTAVVRKKMAAHGGAVSAGGWSRDDRAIGWAYKCNSNSAIKGTCPLSHSFCLSTLNFGPTPDGSFQQAISQRGGYEIQRTKERVATVWLNGGVVSQYQIPNLDAKVRCRTLLSGNRAAVGCDYGLYVFNTQTGQGIHTLPGHSDAVLTLAPSVSQRYLLSGSIDHTLEIWNIEAYEHLASLFFAGNEWIAWTPQGYYASSVGGESLMGWHVNQGPDQLGQFFPASRFHTTHYRPDVIRTLLDSRSVRQAVISANSHRDELERQSVVSLAPPPNVAITQPAPAPQEPVASPVEITATAKSRSDDPIVALRVLVNGRPTETRRIDNPSGGKSLEATETFSLALPPGRHQVVVRGDTARSYDLSPLLDLTVAGDAAANPALYVLAIGADVPAGISGSGAAFGKDASQIAETLKIQAGKQYSQVHVKSLTGPQATLAGIREGLEWLAAHATPSDAAIIYFGATATQNERGEALLLPSDARLTEGGLPAAELQSRLAKIRGKTMLWTDWRSALAAAARTVHDFCLGIVTESHFAGAAVDDLLRELVGTDQGVAVISANSGTATEGVVPPLTSIGWFAQALAEGLNGRAATDGADGVSLSELEEYVKQRVGELSGNRWRPNVGRSPLIPSIPLTK
jgi:WD40 repeat protein